LNDVHEIFERSILKKKQSVRAETTEQRRDQLRAALVAAAERTIENGGLHDLRARTLAENVGCAVGAIYNAVDDLDELILLANSRTLAELERDLTAVHPDDGDEPDAAIAQLVQLALAYMTFAATHTWRWRALFDHRMAGREVPEWYRGEQQRLFRYIEAPLRVLQRRATPKRRALLARSLFSAVHGLISLGLEERLEAIPLPVLREQVTFIVTTIGRGMAAPD
jgi:AcrR family transcriptional regulator